MMALKRKQTTRLIVEIDEVGSHLHRPSDVSQSRRVISLLHQGSGQSRICQVATVRVLRGDRKQRAFVRPCAVRGPCNQQAPEEQRDATRDSDSPQFGAVPSLTNKL